MILKFEDVLKVQDVLNRLKKVFMQECYSILKFEDVMI